MNALFHCIIEFLFKAVRPILYFFIVGTNNFIEYLQSYQILIFIYYKFYSIILFIIINNTVYSVCCRYTSCNLKQKQGSNCLLSIRRKWFLFIHIVPGNIVDFWNSDFLKKSQLDLPSAWIFFLYLLLCMNCFLGIFPCMNFFFGFFPTPPPPPHHFLMVRPSEYAAQVWRVIPAYLSDAIESIQRRGLTIIFANSSYQQALDQANLTSLADRRIFICKRLMVDMRNESNSISFLAPQVMTRSGNTKTTTTMKRTKRANDFFTFRFS